jgi:hypothetical protein
MRCCTLHRTHWVWSVMSVVAPRMFSLTVSMVRGRVWYTSVCIWSQRKISRCERSSEFDGHSIGPPVLSPSREELPPTIFSTRQRYEVVLRPAESQTDVRRVAFSGISSTCCSHTPFNSCRYRSAFTLPSRNTGSERVFPCIAHDVIILGWVRWWASPATWRLSWAQYTVLCRFTYQLQYKHASSPHTISSARGHCDLTMNSATFINRHVILVQTVSCTD